MGSGGGLAPFRERVPSLPEKLAILEDWFEEAATKAKEVDKQLLDYKEVSAFLVKKGIFSDLDSAAKFTLKTLKIKKPENNTSVHLSVNQFQKLFCRNIFKESLVEVLQKIEQAYSGESIKNAQGDGKHSTVSGDAGPPAHQMELD